jgi:hypothetical protein
MGHNTASVTMRFRSERDFFQGYRRALLLKSDQLLFDELWDVIETYVPAVEKSTHPLMIATLLMSMILEQRKMIGALQVQMEKLEHEVQAGQRSLSAEITRLKEELQRLDEEVDTRLRAVRVEFSEMLYPSDGAL